MSSFSLPEFGARQPHTPNLGFHLSENTSATPAEFFGITPASELMSDLNTPAVMTISDFPKIAKLKPEQATLKLEAKLATDLTGSTSLKMAKNAVGLGKVVHDSIHAVETSDKDKVEAVACQTAKVVAELGFKAVGVGTVTAGIPLLLTEAAAFPPLALAIPVTAAALPDAYAAADAFSKFAGQKAEADCHLLFRDLVKHD